MALNFWFNGALEQKQHPVVFFTALFVIFIGKIEALRFGSRLIFKFTSAL